LAATGVAETAETRALNPSIVDSLYYLGTMSTTFLVSVGVIFVIVCLAALFASVRGL
jgi:uncharacterized membrane protein